MRKDWALIGIIVLILVVGVGLFSYLKVGKKEVVANPLPSDINQEVAGTTTEVYFAEDAKVMYFYTDTCHWCEKEKEVLNELAKEDFRVKGMNLGEKSELAKEYNVSGTPTFISENGDRLEGYQTIDKLKPWLEEHR